MTLEKFQESVIEAKTNIKNLCFYKFILIKNITKKINLIIPCEISNIITNNLFYRTLTNESVEKAIKQVENALIAERELGEAAMMYL